MEPSRSKVPGCHVKRLGVVASALRLLRVRSLRLFNARTDADPNPGVLCGGLNRVPHERP